MEITRSLLETLRLKAVRREGGFMRELGETKIGRNKIKLNMCYERAIIDTLDYLADYVDGKDDTDNYLYREVE